MASSSGIQDTIEKTVISNLGEIVKTIQCRFSCGGSLPQVDNVTVIYYTKKPGNFHALTLPADVMEDKNLPEFLKACSTASFDICSRSVTDPTYRDALKLDPDCFIADFELANTTILGSIASIMAVGSSIRAELYKLNVYSIGSHFKAHVDTPRSPEMFASLVVSLPSQFTGGALVTRHLGHRMTFDWSSSPTTTQWAAFYSDVEYEVLPVTSGHCFTLTYNLYHTLPACHPASLDIATSPLHKELQAALKTPHFLRGGGTLGFFCRYRYVECENDDFLMFGDVPFLRGEDMIIYRVAKLLNLSVQLKAICLGGDDNGYTDFIVPSFLHKVNEFPDEESNDEAKLAEAFGHVVNAKNVHWCVWTEERKVPLLSTVYLGNNATAEVYYQSAALLMEVPKFTDGRGVPVASVQAVLSCIEQVDEEISKGEADIDKFNNEIKELEADIGNIVEKIVEKIEGDSDEVQKFNDKREELKKQVYLKRNQLTHMKSNQKMVQDRHPKLLTERNELMFMVPPSKRAKN